MIRFTINLPDNYGPRLNKRLRELSRGKSSYGRYLVDVDLGIAIGDRPAFTDALPDPVALTQRAKQALRDAR